MSHRNVMFGAALTLAAAGVADAKGPLLLFDPAAKVPFAYPTATPVPYMKDLGDLGAFFTNAEIDGFVDAAYASWEAVPTATIAFGDAGDLSTDIETPAEFAAILADTTDVGIMVIYDTDGDIFSDFFGVDPTSVNGAASPKTSIGVSPVIKSSWVLLNGLAVESAADEPGYPGVVTHEAGHSINLAHTQVNGGSLLFGDADFVFEGVCFGMPPWVGFLSSSDFETMNPFQDLDGSTGPEAATVDIADDIASVSDLYPAPGYPAGVITGTIFYPDGVTPITGVNVVARPDDSATGHSGAVTSISGDYTQGMVGDDGVYFLSGLTPDTDYLIYVDKLIAGAFSTPKADPLPGLEEYFNDTESSTDDICMPTPVTPEAGVPMMGVDIIFNATECVRAECPPDTIALPGPLEREFCVLNCASEPADIFASVVDDSLWCGIVGDDTATMVPPGETVCFPVACDVEIEGGTSVVTWTVSSGAAVDSCKTTIVADIGVPVLLSDFRGVSLDRAVQLEWTLGGFNEATAVWIERSTGEVGPFVPLHESPLRPAYRMRHLDNSVAIGDAFFYRVRAELSGGGETTSPTLRLVHGSATVSTLHAPSLVDDRTRAAIGFSVGPVRESVRLDVLDVQGRRIATLVDESLERGEHQVSWSLESSRGDIVGGGVYFLSLRVGRATFTRKLLVLR